MTFAARYFAYVVGVLSALGCLLVQGLCTAEQPSAAVEADVPPTAREVARRRYQDGAASYQQGRYKDAIDLFLEADRLMPSAALSFNIARAYEKLNDHAGALRWYRDYLRRAGTPEDAAEVGALIKELEGRLERKGIQQVTLLSEPRGATVLIDGNPVGVSPWTGELAPGPHRVSLRLRGYQDAERDFRLEADRSLDVSLRLVPAPASGSAASSAPGASADSRQSGAPLPADATASDTEGGQGFPFGTVGVIALSAGGAALGGALVFELLRRSAESDAQNAPQTRFADDLSRMDARQTTARVLAGVGAGLAVAGGVLLAIDLGLFSSGDGANETTVSMGCVASGCGASARGTF